MSWLRWGLSTIKRSAQFNYSELQDLRWEAQLAINLLIAAPGAVVWYYTDGLLAFVGAVWVLLNVLPIVKWVVMQ